MHPAYSIILFSSVSGAGYGILFWLGLGQIVGAPAHSPFWSGIAAMFGLGLVTAGLLSSLAHLGHPERAWRALSQWRSSWLSREGVAAVFTFFPATPLCITPFVAIPAPWLVILSGLTCAGALVTVCCTGMIYASLPTIRQWHTPLVPVCYLVLALATGAIVLALLDAFSQSGPPWIIQAAGASLALGAVVKWLYWRRAGQSGASYTAAMATGLVGGVVRQLDPPHGRPNFVMREMGYRIARAHVKKLRRIAFGTLFVVPLTLIICAAPGVLIWSSPFNAGVIAPLFLAIAAISASIGVLTERWLFFAEAVHVSQLYYGLDRA